MKFVRTNTLLMGKIEYVIEDRSLQDMLIDLEEVLCIQTMDVLPDTMVTRCDIIIIENHISDNCLEDSLIDVISIDDLQYELRSNVSIE